MARRPFEGEWQWVDEQRDGSVFLTDRHVCVLVGSRDRPLPPAGELDEAEAARLFRSFAGPYAGSVTIVEDGDEWRHDAHIAVAASPVALQREPRRMIRVDGDEMQANVILPDGARAPTDQFRRLSAPGTSARAGAWRLESDELDGMLCMTDSRYRYLVTRKDRPQATAPSAELADAEVAQLYHSFDAQGGSYAVEGSAMVRTPELAKDSREQGWEVRVEFRLDSDTLTTRNAAGDEQVWRRLD